MTPDEALAQKGPTDGFLCPLSANTYGLDFLEFEIKDYDSGESIFHVKKDPEAGLPMLPDDIDPEIEKAVRTVKYTFPEKFLRFKTVRTALVFSVGPEPVPNFRMIERHYFKGDLIRSYDFNFGFCIPGSTNSWEAIYGVPEMTEKRIMDLMDSPFEMQSDSFYYVGDTLVMHNKAAYSYQG
uniref:GMP phosphodiesterase delta subunit domain-containing protein n=1 Tax=Mantoniella antarctica TaxID=81844 RepID=A0A7S0SA66_9CHLO|mmetsp:Transcript_16180/g.39794  ORF Transcript_16180/g.39794 Transcript_16180/m.39794 type:complete len:182 (+) Transcript_16180:312-857(+)